jgi:hypothetical protein
MQIKGIMLTPKLLLAAAEGKRPISGEKTASKWELGDKLKDIKAACGDNIKAWTAAYRKIGMDRRRVSEVLLYRQVFKSRAEAAQYSVPQANLLIHQAKVGKKVYKK